ACAKMTRLIALKLIQSSLGTPSQAAQAILSGEVASQEQSTWSPLGQVVVAKSGSGRFTSPELDRCRVSRIDR
ncbi:MAG: hypothetical protein AAGG69_15520, partial [Pseudomonadota bacterium]